MEVTSEIKWGPPTLSTLMEELPWFQGSLPTLVSTGKGKSRAWSSVSMTFVLPGAEKDLGLIQLRGDPKGKQVLIRS
jgi:hypothetical protein